MRFFIKHILALFARALLWKYKPDVVAVTGSVGKTSTKDAIACVLRSHLSIFATPENLNTEFGVPSTIVGVSMLSAYDSALKMVGACMRIFFRTARLLAWHDSAYPRVLVLEMGADKPGDIAYLAWLAPAHVAIVTAIAPAHLEGFKTLAAIEKEKKEVYRSLGKRDWIVADSDNVKTLPEATAAHMLVFQRQKARRASQTDISISQVRERLEFVSGKIDIGLSFHVQYRDQSTLIELSSVIGSHFVTVATYAVGAGLIYDMSLDMCAQALRGYVSPKSRMRPLAGVKQTLLIDDTYNASPVAIRKALDVLEQFEIDSGARRWAVLGDMFEMGGESAEAHADVGAYAAQKNPDFLVCVGPRARMIADVAASHGLDESTIFRFDDPVTAGRAVQEKMKKGDIILVKGSQGIRLEKCVKELMAEPERASELLVRQGKSWK